MRYVRMTEILEVPVAALLVITVAQKAEGVLSLSETKPLPDAVIDATDVADFLLRPQRDLNSCYRRERPMS